MTPERIVVESWAPDYGVPFAPDDELDATPQVDTSVETDSGAWAPIPVADAEAAATEILFVDGVQRVDARVTLVDGELAVAGMAGSFAAGACDHRAGRATVGRVEVRRGLFTRASDVALECGAGVRYAPYAATDTVAATLVRAMTEQMRALERVLAQEADAELVVLDGPLSGGRHVPTAVGLVKTHRRMYLDDAGQRVVASLEPGQRTPLFLTVAGGGYSRWSWYLRLPGPGGHPWAGVVRLEAAEDELTVSEARRLAACTQATIPRFASSPHRDPRAPQNLTPIGALEQQLRHRLGDAALIERMLRRTCATWTPTTPDHAGSSYHP